MTTATIALSELAEKGADADFIRQTLQHALQRLMEMDAESLCRAAYGERTDDTFPHLIRSGERFSNRCCARSAFDQAQSPVRIDGFQFNQV